MAEKAKTERIKQLLSSYYGGPGGGGQQQQQQQQQQPDSRSGAVGREQQQRPSQEGFSTSHHAARASTGSGGAAISLDSPAFNPDRHISQMIQTYSVERLMAEHKGMAKEIKNLDSDMQQLVYENYNKFIAATDTIRSMKSNVDSMETDIDQLRSNMDLLVDRSSGVNAKLLKRRQHIEELNRVQGLLVKLQAVFDLPSRMQAALDEDALDSAVSFYAEALPVLRKYGHKGAFRGVAVQADAAAKQVSTALKRRLAERKDETEHVVLLLRQLGEGDDTLQEKYLQGRKERMQRILQEASAVADAMAAAGQAPARRSRGGGSDSGPAAAAAAALPGVEDAASWGVAPDGTPPALGAFVKALDERLINAMQETVMNMNTIFLQNDRTAARRKPLVSLAKDIISQYFKLVRRVVSDASMAAVATAACLHLAGADKDFRVTAPSLSFPDAWGADLVMQAMSAVTTDIGLLHSQLPELSLRDLAAAATEQVVQGHVNAAFAALQERLNSGVGMLCQQLSTQQPGLDLQAQVQPLLPAYSYLCDVIQRGTTALLKGLRVYEQGRLLSAWQDRLSDAIQAQLAALFSSACSSFLRLAGVKEGSDGRKRDDGAGKQAGAAADGQPNTGLVLVLAKLCVHMETTTVPYVVEVLVGAFQGRGLAGSDGPPRFVGGEVARRLGSTANLLLSTYVELHGSELSLLVQQSMAARDWLSVPAPAAPQPVCDLLLELLARAEAEVARLLDSTGRQQGGGGRGEGGHHQRGGSVTDVLLESGAVERGVAKLFRGKVTPFGNSVRFTQSAALSAIAIVGLKSLVEHVRLATLGTEGVQQLQLDVCYMRPRLLQLVGGADAEPVAQLLDDVLGAAAERCVAEPALLDAPALEQALAAANSSSRKQPAAP